MALTIPNFPVTYSSANDDLVATCKEPSLYQLTNFKFICDIYIGGIKVAQLKSFPNPVTTFGVFNIGNVVRNYVNSNLTYLPFTAGVRVDKFTSHTTLVECKFGFEYGAIVSQFLNQETRSAYYTNTYNKRKGFNITSTPILTSKVDNYATNRPTAKTNIFLPSAGVAAPLLVPFYNGDVYPTSPQNLILTTVVTKNDGTVVTASTITSTNSAIDYTMIQFDLSPLAINTALGITLIDSTTLKYYVSIGIVSAGGTTPVLSPTFFPYCEAKYEVFTLVFLNQYGGYDSYHFSKKSTRQFDSTKKSYQRIPYMIEPTTGVMSYVQISGGTSSKVFVENTIVYDSQFKETMTLNTDIIDEANYEWLSELVISPSVFIFLNDSFYPVLIKESNYDFKKKINDKVFNLTLNIELQDQMNTQYR